MFDDIIAFIRELYAQSEGPMSLHEPRFLGNEKAYVADAIDSTFVSSVGKYVDRFEQMLAQTTGVKYAVATVNGTAALHVALILAGVKAGDEVITQPLTFVATCNAMSYIGAIPHFVDVNRQNMGLCPKSLQRQLEEVGRITSEGCLNKITGRRIAACVPMHTFGHPAEIDAIVAVCEKWNIPVVEDAAESLGSYYKGTHTGAFGLLATLSFNGNKIITTGGGGAILTNHEDLAKKAKHLTTTAKVPHPYHYVHDQTAYNYRLPNLNAALGCAQLEQLENFLANKRELARCYENFFKTREINFFTEPQNAHSNYWLNAITLKDHLQQKQFLERTHACGIMTRPIWQLMNRLSMFKNAPQGPLDEALWLSDRIVNLPSSTRMNPLMNTELDHA